MPELPEVETSCRGISPHISGEVLTKVTVRNAQLRWPVPVAQLEALQGEVLKSVQRRGKYIQLMFDSGYVLLHLGMSGNVRIVCADEAVKKHDHIDLAFANGSVLRLNDPRRFGCCLYQEGCDIAHPLLEKLGPEPLSSDFEGDYLFLRSRKKTQAIKTFIMDSQVVVGVGNIYAAEALFQAGIHPMRAAGTISKKRYIKLLHAIKEILSLAIEQGGTTLKDFVGSDGKPGYFKQKLHVYDREGEKCVQCDKMIKKITIAQRSTYYCGQCQT